MSISLLESVSVEEERLNILFVCGKNQWRSPTGEFLYRDDSRMLVRSSGLSKTSKRRLTAADLEWADLVFVMEFEQRRKIVDLFQKAIELPELVSLEIPDIYPYMHPELIELLRGGVEAELEEWAD